MRLIRRRWIGLGLLVAIALLLLWVLWSTAGLRLLLRQVPGLSSEQESGRLVGPIGLGSLRWSDGAMIIEASGVDVDHRFWPLVTGELSVRQITIERLRVQLPPPPEPAPAPTPASQWSLSLPVLDLPGDLQLASLTIAALELDDADSRPLLRGQVSLSELSLVDGRISLGDLQAEADDIGRLQLVAELDSTRQWNGQLRLQAELQQGEISQLSLKGQGNLERYQFELQSSGALTASAEIALSALATAPAWQLRAEGARSGGEGAALSFALNGSGERAMGSLSGRLRHGEQQIELRTLQGGLADDQRLLVESAEMALNGPLSLQLSAQGQWPLSESAPTGEMQLGWIDLVLADAQSPLRSAQGQLQLAGRTEDYALELQAELSRAAEDPALSASGTLKLQAGGDLQRLQSLLATLDSNFGRIQIDGQLQFDPLLAEVELLSSGLDTGVLLPDWPGELGLRGHARLSRQDEQLGAVLRIDELSGQLRQAVLRGAGDLAWVESQLPSGELRLDWGGNELAYSRSAGADGRLLLQLEQLSLLRADLQGSVRGGLSLPARLDDWRQASGELVMRELRLAQLEVERLALQRAAGVDQALAVQGQGLQAAGQLIDSLRAQLQPGERWELQVEATGPQLDLRLAASAGQEEGAWSGQLRDLQFSHGDYPALQLDQASSWRWAAEASTLEDSCLAVREGRICLQLRHAPGSGLQLDGRFDALQLAWLEPLWVDTPARMTGELSGTLAGRWDGERQLRLDGALQMPALAISLPSPDDDDQRLERVAALRLDLGQADDAAEVMPGQRATLTLDFAEQGLLRVQAQGDALADEPGWTVAVHSEGLALQLLEGMHPELIAPRGRLSADLRLYQQQAQWASEGQLALREGAMELPAAGLQLRELALALQATPSGVFEITGSGRSGDGQFQLSGSYPLDPQANARLSVQGENVQVVNLPIARMAISPDLQLERRDGLLRASGSVRIPSALIDLARFEPSVKASSDVVVVDDPPAEEGLPLKVRADIQVQMGEAVRLKGFGLDGRLSGALGVRERPGRPTTGRGELNVTGAFRAYGQDLTIKRGKLLFSGGPLANPGLDLLAIREVDAIEAGVRVRGAAERPELSVYSDPPMDQAEAFSYLVLGRPLNAASGDDAQQLGAAAAALGSVGGSLIASKLGNNGSGLSVGVESSADLGGAALTVGRFITPDIYFGVGQSLFEQIQVAILRYRLTSRFELEALSGRELKAGVNYRHEE